ncbi:hypothetical protein BV372_17165 [Nostoc sp. T09]|uniref:hypothetical protein n=1 Tax=Nostoc sp. T09 TaxID=1932621 RepID=UPI000A395673|nr:hypothetical protein [Nostoc sp. T09]OUL33220.1 hypothetical protein BV372_17165 [Nostoc sp. T09]
MQLLKSENKKTSILPMFAVGTLGLHVLTLLVLMFHWTILQRLNRQTTLQSLVQLIDGRAITVDPQENLERYPEAIRRFVGETMTLMLTWSQQQPPKTVWEISSQLVTEDFQPKLAAEITNLIPGKQLENFNKSTEQILVIQRISQPTQVAPGKWRLQMVANQLIFHGSDRLGESIPVNKHIFVQATDEIVAALPNAPVPLQLAAFRISEARLQIYRICDIKDKSCSESSL